MSTIAQFGMLNNCKPSSKKAYSYQHVMGLMLVNLNKLANKLNLSHSEYRLMANLIGLWNKNHNMAFPTIDYLAQNCCMGRSTIAMALKKLVRLNLLIVIRTSGKRNNYYFGQILTGNTSPNVKPECDPPCRTAHDNKQIKIKPKNRSLVSNDNRFNYNVFLGRMYALRDKLNSILKKDPDKLYSLVALYGYKNKDKINENVS